MRSTEAVDEHLDKMEAQLKAWGATLEKLLAEANEAGDGARVDHRQRMDELKAKHREVQARLEELKTQRGERWAAFKTGVEGAWKELEVAFKHLTGPG